MPARRQASQPRARSVSTVTGAAIMALLGARRLSQTFCNFGNKVEAVGVSASKRQCSNCVERRCFHSPVIPRTLDEQIGSPSLAARLSMAVTAVRAASRLTKKLQSRIGAHIKEGMSSQGAAQKADASPVTLADFAAQAIVLSLLNTEFPEDGAIAEETAEALDTGGEAEELLPALTDILQEATSTMANTIDLHSKTQVLEALNLSQKGSGKQYTWILDPIDGTRGFMAREQFCIALALLGQDSKPQLGILGCPADNEGRLYIAVKGHGAFVMPLEASSSDQEVRLEVSKRALGGPEQIQEAIIMEGPFTVQAKASVARKRLGLRREPLKLDSQVKYGRLAFGDGDLILRLPKDGYQEYIWDHAAGSLIVEEAGGSVTDLDGNALDFSLGRQLSPNVKGIVASAGGALHEQARKAARAAVDGLTEKL